MKKFLRICGIAFAVLINIGIFYFLLPVLSVKNAGMWCIVILDLILAALLLASAEKTQKLALPFAGAAGIALLILIVAAIAGSQMFNASRYSSLLDIQVSEKADLPKESELEYIPLMDTESSKVLGNRKIGALNEIVSQFEVSNSYMTIAYGGQPVKVSALKYAGLWKWASNRNKGVPGYVTVYPNDLTAEYVELEKGMKYVPSAFFSEDLRRYIYAHYPSVFFDTPHMEIDETGAPYYVAPTYEHAIGLFGGKKITGAILVNPVTGDIRKYAAKDLPAWVDIVYDGDYVAKYFDIYGKLINGFWNKLFGQKGLIESTTTTTYDSDGDAHRDNDFGYIVRDNDIYIYTGVTAVTNDESNIGYLMANERTGKVIISYFESTDEDSVMRAAEGEVQEKGYRASFPSLVQIGADSAYVMVLKDNLGLVKLYAVVDAQQYSRMAVADSLEKAIAQFSGSRINEQEMKEVTLIVKRVEFITQNNETRVYLVDAENRIYNAAFDPRMLLWEAGQEITVLSDGTSFVLK